MMSKQNSNSYFFSSVLKRQTDKCVITQLSTVFFCIYANLPRFLLDDNMSLTQAKKNLSFCTILLMLFYTLGVSIYRLIIFLYFCSLQTRGIDRISIRYIHYFSLWLAHLVDISKFKFSEANSNRIIDTH
jgi:hypothetical protein